MKTVCSMFVVTIGCTECARRVPSERRTMTQSNLKTSTFSGPKKVRQVLRYESGSLFYSNPIGTNFEFVKNLLFRADCADFEQFPLENVCPGNFVGSHCKLCGPAISILYSANRTAAAGAIIINCHNTIDGICRWLIKGDIMRFVYERARVSSFEHALRHE